MGHNSSDKDAVFLVLLLYTNTVDFHSSNIWLKCRFSELQIQFYKLNHWLKISFTARFPFNSMINKYHLHPSSLYTLLISFIFPSPLYSPHLPFIFPPSFSSLTSVTHHSFASFLPPFLPFSSSYISIPSSLKFSGDTQLGKDPKVQLDICNLVLKQLRILWEKLQNAPEEN